ncbi:MAG: hypothetical protein WC477_07250, partial [Patescibacteria group bacterium]
MARKNIDEILSVMQKGGGGTRPTPSSSAGASTGGSSTSKKNIDDILKVMQPQKATPSSSMKQAEASTGLDELRKKGAGIKDLMPPKPVKPPEKRNLDLSQTIFGGTVIPRPSAQTSTAAIPTGPGVESANQKFDSAMAGAEQTFNTIKATTEKLRQYRKESISTDDNLTRMASADVRLIGAVADNILESGKHIATGIMNVKPTLRESAATAAMPTLESILYASGGFLVLQAFNAVPEIAEAVAAPAGPEVQEGAREAGNIFNEKIMGGISTLAGGATEWAYRRIMPNATDSEVQAARDVGGLAGLILAFHGARGVYTAIPKGKADPVLQASGDVLGMDVKWSNKPSPKKIEKAFAAKMHEAAASDSPVKAEKMDALKVARDALIDYSRAPTPEAWSVKWDSRIKQAQNLASDVAEFGRTVVESNKVERATTGAVSPASRRAARAIEDPVTQYAFEREIIEMAGKSDPKNIKTNHVDDPYDTRPAFYDTATGEITFNDAVIAADVAKLLRGDVISIGGKVPRRFEAKMGEHPEDLILRYKETIAAHEMAHAVTITPEDIAKLRAADAAGSQKEIDSIRRDLESRAERYIVENTPKPKLAKRSPRAELRERADSLAERVTARRDVERKTTEDLTSLRAERETLRFATEAEEAQYTDWKRRVSRDPELRNMDVASMQEKLSGRAAAYERAKKGGKVSQAEVVRMQERSRVLENLPDSDAVLDTFRERLTAEKKIAEKIKEAKTTLESRGKETKVERLAREAIEREEARRTKVEAKRKNEPAERQKNLRESEVGRVREEAKTEMSRREVRTTIEKAMIRDAAERVKAKLRQKFVDKADAQQTLVDFMKKNRVPQGVRGRFITKLKNAKNAESAASVIDAIRKEWDGYERAGLQRKILKELKRVKIKTKAGLPKGKLSADMQSRIDAIREYVKRPRAEILAERLRIVEEWRDKEMVKDPNSRDYDLPENIQREIDLLDLGGIKEQTLPQLRNTLESIRSYVEEGRTARQKRAELKHEEQKEISKSVIKDIHGQETRPLETAPDPSFQEASTKKAFRWFMNQSSPFQALARRVGGKFQELAERLTTDAYTATSKTNATWEGIASEAERIYGGTQKLATARHEMKKRIDLGEAVNAEGETVAVRMSRNEALDAWMQNQTELGKKIIESGNKWTEEIKQKVFSILTAEDKAMGRWMIDEGYTKKFEDLRKTFAERRGVDLGYRENYAGQLQYEGERIPEHGLGGFAEGVLHDSAQYQLSIDPSFVRKSKGANRPLKFSDPLQKLFLYTRKADWYTTVSSRVDDIMNVLRDTDTRKALADKYGEDFVKTLDYHAENFMRGGQEYEWSMGAIDRMSQGVFKAILATPSVAAGQVSALAQFRGEARLDGLNMKAYRRGLKNWRSKEYRKMLAEYAPSIKVRTQRALRDISRP